MVIHMYRAQHTERERERETDTHTYLYIERTPKYGHTYVSVYSTHTERDTDTHTHMFVYSKDA
jgi:hypothetical protein